MLSEIKLHEFLEDKNIFTIMYALEPMEFLKGDNQKVFNDHLIINHGEKIVFNKYLSIDINVLSSIILSKYSKKWYDLVNVRSLNMASSNSTLVDSSSSEDGAKTDKNNSVDNVAGMNDASMIGVKGNDSTISSDYKNNSKSGSNTHIINIKSLFTNLSIAEKITIINVVIKDTSDYLTLNIY